MKVLIYFILLFSVTNPRHFDREAFYKSFNSSDLKRIDTELEKLTELSIPNKSAFEGALLMKKSGLVIDKKEKLKLFKKGNKLLESSILADPENCEYRFLRLVIQENAPKVLGYNKNIKEDCNFIKNAYKNTSEILKKNILHFSKNSLNLRLSS